VEVEVKEGPSLVSVEKKQLLELTLWRKEPKRPKLIEYSCLKKSRKSWIRLKKMPMHLKAKSKILWCLKVMILPLFQNAEKI